MGADQVCRSCPDTDSSRSRSAAPSGYPAALSRCRVYCASKWAVEGWAESIAYEVEPFGIDIILIEPGPYRTQIWQSTPRVHPTESPYRTWVQQVLRAADAHAARVARDPKEVALAILKALEAKHPRFRYSVGFFAHLNHFLRGKVPSRLLRKATGFYLGLSKRT